MHSIHFILYINFMYFFASLPAESLAWTQGGPRWPEPFESGDSSSLSAAFMLCFHWSLGQESRFEKVKRMQRMSWQYRQGLVWLNFLYIVIIVTLMEKAAWPWDPQIRIIDEEDLKQIIDWIWKKVSNNHGPKCHGRKRLSHGWHCTHLRVQKEKPRRRSRYGWYGRTCMMLIKKTIVFGMSAERSSAGLWGFNGGKISLLEFQNLWNIFSPCVTVISCAIRLKIRENVSEKDLNTGVRDAFGDSDFLNSQFQPRLLCLLKVGSDTIWQMALSDQVSKRSQTRHESTSIKPIKLSISDSCCDSDRPSTLAAFASVFASRSWNAFERRPFHVRQTALCRSAVRAVPGPSDRKSWIILHLVGNHSCLHLSPTIVSCHVTCRVMNCSDVNGCDIWLLAI